MHPTLRLDSYMRGTDPSYQTVDGAVGKAFIRKMGTYGRSRPSVVFTNESRATRAFLGKEACYDMSNLPATFNEARGDPREGTLEYPQPRDPDTSFVEMYKNHTLMLPSERFREHLAMKDGERQWRADREAAFFHNKRLNMVERHHKQGVVGVDSPMHPGSTLYASHGQTFQTQAERKDTHTIGRHGKLSEATQSSDATACRNWAEPIPDMKRSSDIPAQRKCIDPDTHPFRFLDTHDRMNPTDVPFWDDERASVLRGHDVRHKRHNIITGEEAPLKFW